MCLMHNNNKFHNQLKATVVFVHNDIQGYQCGQCKVNICWNISYLFVVHWLTVVMCSGFNVIVLIFVEDIFRAV